MTTASHIIVGIATGVVFHETGLSPFTRTESMFLGAIVANLPDINLAWHRKLKTHHFDFTHFPFYLLAFVFGIFLLETLAGYNNHFWSTFLGLSFFIHMVMDTFGNTIGIHWFYPFSKREHSFTSLRKDMLEATLKERLSVGVLGKVFWAEIAVWVISLVIIFTNT